MEFKEFDEFVTQILSSTKEAADATERSAEYTPVEIVDIDEIYLLEDAGNGTLIKRRRICGAPRVYNNPKLRCRLPAGFQTNHRGYSRCRNHECRNGRKYGALSVLKYYKTKGWALNLFEAVEMYPELLNDETMSTIKDEILITQMMLSKEINNDFPDEKMVITLTDLLGKLKFLKSKIEVERLTINVNSIRLFVQSFFDIAKKKLNQDQYSDLVNSFNEEILIPANSSMQKLLLDKNKEVHEEEDDIETN